MPTSLRFVTRGASFAAFFILAHAPAVFGNSFLLNMGGLSNSFQLFLALVGAPALLDIGGLAICYPFFLILALLFAALYAQGKSPLAFLDLSAPRPRAPQRYRWRTITGGAAARILRKQLKRIVGGAIGMARWGITRRLGKRIELGGGGYAITRGKGKGIYDANGKKVEELDKKDIQPLKLAWKQRAILERRGLTGYEAAAWRAEQKALGKPATRRAFERHLKKLGVRGYERRFLMKAMRELPRKITIGGTVIKTREGEKKIGGIVIKTREVEKIGRGYGEIGVSKRAMYGRAGKLETWFAKKASSWNERMRQRLERKYGKKGYEVRTKDMMGERRITSKEAYDLAQKAGRGRTARAYAKLAGKLNYYEQKGATNRLVAAMHEKSPGSKDALRNHISLLLATRIKLRPEVSLIPGGTALKQSRLAAAGIFNFHRDAINTIGAVYKLRAIESSPRVAAKLLSRDILNMEKEKTETTGKIAAANTLLAGFAKDHGTTMGKLKTMSDAEKEAFAKGKFDPQELSARLKEVERHTHRSEELAKNLSGAIGKRDEAIGLMKKDENLKGLPENYHELKLRERLHHAGPVIKDAFSTAGKVLKEQMKYTAFAYGSMYRGTWSRRKEAIAEGKIADSSVTVKKYTDKAAKLRGEVEKKRKELDGTEGKPGKRAALNGIERNVDGFKEKVKDLTNKVANAEKAKDEAKAKELTAELREAETKLSKEEALHKNAEKEVRQAEKELSRMESPTFRRSYEEKAANAERRGDRAQHRLERATEAYDRDFKLPKLEAEVAIAQKTIAQKGAEIAKIKEEIPTRETEVKRSEAEVADRQRILKETEKKASGTPAEVAKAMFELPLREAELAKANNNLTKAKNALEGAETRHDEAVKFMNLKHAETAPKMEELKRLVEKAEFTGLDANAARAKLAVREFKKEDQTTEVNNKSSERKQLEVAIATGQADISKLSAQSQTLAKELKDLAEDKELADDAGELEAVAQIKKQMEAVKGNLRTQMHAVNLKEAELAAAKNNLTAADTEIKRLNSDVVDTNAELKKYGDFVESRSRWERWNGHEFLDNQREWWRERKADRFEAALTKEGTEHRKYLEGVSPILFSAASTGAFSFQQPGANTWVNRFWNRMAEIQKYDTDLASLMATIENVHGPNLRALFERQHDLGNIEKNFAEVKHARKTAMTAVGQQTEEQAEKAGAFKTEIGIITKLAAIVTTEDKDDRHKLYEGLKTDITKEKEKTERRIAELDVMLETGKFDAQRARDEYSAKKLLKDQNATVKKYEKAFVELEKRKDLIDENPEEAAEAAKFYNERIADLGVNESKYREAVAERIVQAELDAKALTANLQQVKEQLEGVREEIKGRVRHQLIEEYMNHAGRLEGASGRLTETTYELDAMNKKLKAGKLEGGEADRWRQLQGDRAAAEAVQDVFRDAVASIPEDIRREGRERLELIEAQKKTDIIFKRYSEGKTLLPTEEGWVSQALKHAVDSLRASTKLKRTGPKLFENPEEAAKLVQLLGADEVKRTLAFITAKKVVAGEVAEFTEEERTTLTGAFGELNVAKLSEALKKMRAHKDYDKEIVEKASKLIEKELSALEAKVGKGPLAMIRDASPGLLLYGGILDVLLKDKLFEGGDRTVFIEEVQKMNLSEEELGELKPLARQMKEAAAEDMRNLKADPLLQAAYLKTIEEWRKLREALEEKRKSGKFTAEDREKEENLEKQKKTFTDEQKQALAVADFIERRQVLSKRLVAASEKLEAGKKLKAEDMLTQEDKRALAEHYIGMESPVAPVAGKPRYGGLADFVYAQARGMRAWSEERSKVYAATLNSTKAVLTRHLEEAQKPDKKLLAEATGKVGKARVEEIKTLVDAQSKIAKGQVLTVDERKKVADLFGNERMGQFSQFLLEGTPVSPEVTNLINKGIEDTFGHFDAKNSRLVPGRLDKLIQKQQRYVLDVLDTMSTLRRAMIVGILPRELEARANFIMKELEKGGKELSGESEKLATVSEKLTKISGQLKEEKAEAKKQGLENEMKKLGDEVQKLASDRWRLARDIQLLHYSLHETAKEWEYVSMREREEKGLAMSRTLSHMKRLEGEFPYLKAKYDLRKQLLVTQEKVLRDPIEAAVRRRNFKAMGGQSFLNAAGADMFQQHFVNLETRPFSVRLRTKAAVWGKRIAYGAGVAALASTFFGAPLAVWLAGAGIFAGTWTAQYAWGRSSRLYYVRAYGGPIARGLRAIEAFSQLVTSRESGWNYTTDSWGNYWKKREHARTLGYFTEGAYKGKLYDKWWTTSIHMGDQAVPLWMRMQKHVLEGINLGLVARGRRQLKTWMAWPLIRGVGKTLFEQDFKEFVISNAYSLWVLPDVITNQRVSYLNLKRSFSPDLNWAQPPADRLTMAGAKPTNVQDWSNLGFGRMWEAGIYGPWEPHLLRTMEKPYSAAEIVINSVRGPDGSPGRRWYELEPIPTLPLAEPLASPPAAPESIETKAVRERNETGSNTVALGRTIKQLESGKTMLEYDKEVRDRKWKQLESDLKTVLGTPVTKKDLEEFLQKMTGAMSEAGEEYKGPLAEEETRLSYRYSLGLASPEEEARLKELHKLLGRLDEMSRALSGDAKEFADGKITFDDFKMKSGGAREKELEKELAAKKKLTEDETGELKKIHESLGIAEKNRETAEWQRSELEAARKPLSDKSEETIKDAVARATSPQYCHSDLLAGPENLRERLTEDLRILGRVMLPPAEELARKLATIAIMESDMLEIKRETNVNSNLYGPSARKEVGGVVTYSRESSPLLKRNQFAVPISFMDAKGNFYISRGSRSVCTLKTADGLVISYLPSGNLEIKEGANLLGITPKEAVTEASNKKFRGTVKPDGSWLIFDAKSGKELEPATPEYADAAKQLEEIRHIKMVTHIANNNYRGVPFVPEWHILDAAGKEITESDKRFEPAKEGLIKMRDEMLKDFKKKFGPERMGELNQLRTDFEKALADPLSATKLGFKVYSEDGTTALTFKNNPKVILDTRVEDEIPEIHAPVKAHGPAAAARIYEKLNSDYWALVEKLQLNKGMLANSEYIRLGVAGNIIFGDISLYGTLTATNRGESIEKRGGLTVTPTPTGVQITERTIISPEFHEEAVSLAASGAAAAVWELRHELTENLKKDMEMEKKEFESKFLRANKGYSEREQAVRDAIEGWWDGESFNPGVRTLGEQKIEAVCGELQRKLQTTLLDRITAEALRNKGGMPADIVVKVASLAPAELQLLRNAGQENLEKRIFENENQLNSTRRGRDDGESRLAELRKMFLAVRPSVELADAERQAAIKGRNIKLQDLRELIPRLSDDLDKILRHQDTNPSAEVPQELIDWYNRDLGRARKLFGEVEELEDRLGTSGKEIQETEMLRVDFELVEDRSRNIRAPPPPPSAAPPAPTAVAPAPLLPVTAPPPTIVPEVLKPVPKPAVVPEVKPAPPAVVMPPTPAEFERMLNERQSLESQFGDALGAEEGLKGMVLEAFPFRRTSPEEQPAATEAQLREIKEFLRRESPTGVKLTDEGLITSVLDYWKDNASRQPPVEKRVAVEKRVELGGRVWENEKAMNKAMEAIRAKIPEFKGWEDLAKARERVEGLKGELLKTDLYEVEGALYLHGDKVLTAKRLVGELEKDPEKYEFLLKQISNFGKLPDKGLLTVITKLVHLNAQLNQIDADMGKAVDDKVLTNTAVQPLVQKLSDQYDALDSAKSLKDLDAVRDALEEIIARFEEIKRRAAKGK